MPQNNIFKSGLYTDAQGQQQYGVDPNAVQTYANAQTPQNINNNVSVPDTINSSLLVNPPAKINTPEPQQPFDYSSFVAGLAPANQNTNDYLSKITSQLDQANQPVQTLESERTGLSGQLKGALDRLTGRTERTQDLVDQTNLTGLQNELADLNTQIASRQAEFDKLITGLEGQGRGITSGLIGGQQARLQRQKAVELGGLAAVAQAVQGNISTAQDLINRTITAEFQPVLDEINTLKEQLALNYDNLTLAEKRRADQMSLILDERTRILTEQKDLKQQINSVMLTAAQNGADANTLKNISNATDLPSALQAAAGFVSSPKDNKPTIIGQDDFGNNIYGRYDALTDSYIPINATGTGFITIPQNIQPNGLPQLAYRNNNPGNLRFANQVGATKGDNGFAKFATPELGYQALLNQVELDKSRGLTVREFISKYAPPSENDTETYIQQLNSSLGSNDNTIISDLSTDALASFIAQKESGTTIQPIGEGVGNKSALEIAQDIFSGNSSLRVSDLPTKMRTAVDKELTKLREDALQSGDLVGVMRASAGGKDVTDTFSQNFSKGVNVINQLSDLQTSIDKEATGPIIGIIRSNNPYDTKAQEIKARLTAIVPNLARGVYGEVGVLTDQDIENYSKTLPNLNSTTEVRNALLGITIRSVQRSLESQIEIQAASGKDMSGFVNIYQAIKQKADELLGEGQDSIQTLISNLNITQSYQSLQDLENSVPEAARVIDRLILQYPNITEEELLAFFNGTL